FSSRRRHTRSYGDWSSDVCSSDLGPEAFEGALRREDERRPLLLAQGVGALQPEREEPVARVAVAARALNGARREADFQVVVKPRSEERRVGKECRPWR